MLVPVIKFIDPQFDFRPVKYSDLDSKLQISDQTLNAVLKFYTEKAKREKQEEIRKSAQNWCLK